MRMCSNMFHTAKTMDLYRNYALICKQERDKNKLCYPSPEINHQQKGNIGNDKRLNNRTSPPRYFLLTHCILQTIYFQVFSKFLFLAWF